MGINSVSSESIGFDKKSEYNQCAMKKHIHLSTLDLTRTRFAFSPLFETVTGFAAMREPSRFAIHLPWICEAQEATRGHDFELLELLTHSREPKRYIPDFLTPPPVTPLPDFADELRLLSATSPEIVRREVALAWPDASGRPSTIQAMMDHPKDHLERLVDQVERFWQLALGPHWSRLRATLEADVLVRARSLALGGAEALFQTIHPLVRYADGVLELDKSMCTPSPPSIELDGRGLLLMPSAFVWPKFMTILDPPWQPILAYTPRGVANLWNDEPPPPNQALEMLFGKGRSEVFLSLDSPSSTLEIARRLHLAQSGVSEHLSVLRQAGLVEAHRRGRSVYYSLSGTGIGLLKLFNAELEVGESRQSELV
jgi:DNA-binding transcriptional ArsR family regulator